MLILLMLMLSFTGLLSSEEIKDNKPINKEVHREMAVNLFNQTWSLLEKKDRTTDEDAMMIHTAHASLFHWKIAGNAENEYIGEWQVSRVYSVLQMFEPALYHAKRALSICEVNQFTGYNLAYAYEGLARAYLVNKNTKMTTIYHKKALEESKNIKDKDDLDYLLSDLKTIIP